MWREFGQFWHWLLVPCALDRGREVAMRKHRSSLTVEGIALICTWETARPAGERVRSDPLARHFIGPLPLGSVLSSCTPSQVEEILKRSPFQEWRVQGGLGWMFVWGRKA